MFYKIICSSVFLINFLTVKKTLACIRVVTQDSYQSRIDSVKEDNLLGYESHSTNSIHKNQEERRYLPIFAKVIVPPVQCKGKNGEIGLCVQKSECKSESRIETGKCAHGYGTCCLETKMCNSSGAAISINSNQTHLRNNPQFHQVCRYEIPKPRNVCQIRLDFLEFKIDEGPNVEIFGDCVGDTFMISGATNAIVGPLCGDLTGQHMYLNYGESERINLDIYLKSDLMQKWDILLTTIRCDSLQKAPEGCLQYFTAQRDTVKSFNYNLKHQLNNQDYSICIRTNPGMKSITWETCGVPYDFVITKGLPAIPDPWVPGGAIGFSDSGNDCQTDWVMFLGDNKYCGSVFPSSKVSTTSKPFIAHVHFNQGELPDYPTCSIGNPNPPPICVPDIENTGFCLEYSQSV